MLRFSHVYQSTIVIALVIIGLFGYRLFRWVSAILPEAAAWDGFSLKTELKDYANQTLELLADAGEAGITKAAQVANPEYDTLTPDEQVTWKAQWVDTLFSWSNWVALPDFPMTYRYLKDKIVGGE